MWLPLWLHYVEKTCFGNKSETISSKCRDQSMRWCSGEMITNKMHLRNNMAQTITNYGPLLLPWTL